LDRRRIVEWSRRPGFAEAEFRHADTRRLKAVLIDAIAHRFANDAGEEGGRRFGADEEAARAELAAELGCLGFAELLARIERNITTPSVWGARTEAAAPTFCTPGSSFSPCIGSGIP
jgi:hypothetical protein